MTSTEKFHLFALALKYQDINETLILVGAITLQSKTLHHQYFVGLDSSAFTMVIALAQIIKSIF